MKKPLTKEFIDFYKNNIHALAKGYQTLDIPIKNIGQDPVSTRRQAGEHEWPLNEALAYFSNLKVISIHIPSQHKHATASVQNQHGVIKILNEKYFNEPLSGISLPITFSIDSRIQVELIHMTMLYAELYDLENRLRHYMDGLHSQIRVPATPQKNIDRAKSRSISYVTDTRASPYEYALFSDFKSIIENNQAVFTDVIKKDICSKLEYLSEIRNFVAHNNILTPDHIERAKLYMGAVRTMLNT